MPEFNSARRREPAEGPVPGEREVRFFKQISAMVPGQLFQLSNNSGKYGSGPFQAKLLRWISVVSIIESDFNGGLCFGVQ